MMHKTNETFKKRKSALTPEYFCRIIKTSVECVENRMFLSANNGKKINEETEIIELILWVIV